MEVLIAFTVGTFFGMALMWPRLKRQSDLTDRAIEVADRAVRRLRA